jgi:hypothetical protein
MSLKVQGTTVVFDDRTFRVAADTTANRPASAQQGMIRYNTDENRIEIYNGSEWEAIAISGGGGAITINEASVSQDYTIDVGQNGHSVGPVTVETGSTVTVSNGQRWVVI